MDKERFPANFEKVRGLEFRETDTMMVGCMKSGSTWCKEVVWLLRNNVDTETAKKVHHDERCPLLEKSTDDGVAFVEKIAPHMSDPRCLKSHLPPDYFRPALDAGVKFIVTTRNVKDSMVSAFTCRTEKFKKNGAVGDGPGRNFNVFFKRHAYSDKWFDINKAWWELNHLPNVHFVKYEDMKKDTRKEIQRLAEFLEVEIDEDQIQAILDHTNIDKMRNNTAIQQYIGEESKVYNFYRKGEVGDWKNHLSEEQSKQMDEQIEERLGGTGLEYEYE